ncbi:MAG TPA: TolC family protein, partial [Puia sp.]
MRQKNILWKTVINYFLATVFITLTCNRILAQNKTLDYYVNAALQNSPLLKDYNNQARSNLIDSLRIRASYKPQIAGNSTNTYYPVINSWGYDNIITNGTNISELIGVTQKIVSKQNLQNQYESIRLQNESLNVTGKISEQDLKKAIITQYISAFGTWQQLNFDNELLGLIIKEETILKQLAENGTYRQTDYLTFLVTVQQQQIQISQARQQYQNECATLNYLSGIADTNFVELSTPLLDSDILPELENTIFYHQFEVDSLKLRNNDAQIDFTYKPKINLYADGGYISSLMYQPYKNFGASFG